MMGRKRGPLNLGRLSPLLSKDAVPPPVPPRQEHFQAGLRTEPGKVIPQEPPLGPRIVRSCPLVSTFILLFLLSLFPGGLNA